MLETKGLSDGLTRRGFLKTTGAVALIGAGASMSGLAPAQAMAEPYEPEHESSKSEDVFRCVCRPNCQGSCSMNVHVREGRVVKTSLAPLEGATEYNRICLRGLSHPFRIADPKRLKYPMRRVGDRGSDEWERITWEEAIDEISERFIEIQSKYGPQALTWWKASGNYGNLGHGFYTTLFNGLDASNMTYDVDLANTVGINRVVGNEANWVLNDAADMVNSKTIFLWGNNITEAQIHEWHFIADAMEAGVKLVVIDPMFTKVASKADIFVPVRPGTDAALTLSMMYVLIEEGLVNDSFMKEFTVAPYLVRSDSGEFLRMSEFGVPPVSKGISTASRDPWSGVLSGPKELFDDPSVVLEADGSPVSSNDAIDPRVTGTYDFRGVKCSTAYDLLCEEVMKYPPETASGICDVPADTIRELARLAADGPCTHRLGWGSQSYVNGVHPAHAGATMVSLLGQIGYPGAGYGCLFIGGGGGADGNLSYVAGTSSSPTMDVLSVRAVLRTGKYKGKDHPLKAAYIYQWNPVCTSTNTKELIEDLFGNLEFIVTADTTYNDTVRYSDIVLPVAHWFEFEDIINTATYRHVLYSEKAVDPPFECKPDSEIVRLLAEKMGLGRFFPATDEEWLRKSMETESASKLGISYDSLKAKKAIRWDAEGNYPYIPWRGSKFKTDSGRMEFYVEKPKVRIDQGQSFDIARERLPRFFPPVEAWQDESNELYEKYPLILMSERPRFRVHSQYWGNDLLRELDPEPIVKINPTDAEIRGISGGEYVECINDRGHCVAKAVLSNGVRPGTLLYPKSWQASQHRAGSWSELATSAYDPVALNQSYFDNLCEIRLWEE